MRKLLAFLMVMVVSVSFAGVAAAGTDTGSLDVSASVVGVCSIDSTSAVDFGAYDGSIDVDSTGGIGVTCTDGLAFQIGLDAGLYMPAAGCATTTRAMKDAGTSYLCYELYQDSTRIALWGRSSPNTMSGTGTGSLRTYNVFGQIPSGQTVGLGSYSDVVTVAVSY